MKRILATISIMTLLTGYGCSGGGGKDNPEPIVVAVPEKAVLISPIQNELRQQGTVISASQSTVTLKWNSAANTDTYEVSLKNLETGSSSTQTTNNTQLDMTLQRNAPYSWSVKSKSTKSTSTAQSDTWKFYNSGLGTLSYAPFPAELVSPSLNSSITATDGKITLTWSGSDVDNDIVGYDVYLDIKASPNLLKSNVSDTIIGNIVVTSGTIYYWKVVTKDSKGNTSQSATYTFTVK
ncbi:hypothetical protein HH214_04740 [Mucilaginibacter robiniae]|uniref:Fibronectin type-III domain-containing protein n=1 Tax=Mucilaginibacter robiniae TaxID=2728022 RepID=A0A7L5DWU9_9SPHI|nr:hypothetical protein [Mucilaginibacter robiniae]QJD95231.1 hypothetical protein HH214_04740 [Mucilaginibacter robiniae]